MSKFENRESPTLNYKILDVKSVERDESGEIILQKLQMLVKKTICDKRALELNVEKNVRNLLNTINDL